MIDIWSSPGDPLFYLHHAWLDKQWFDWQAKNPAVRLSEMGGPNQGWNITQLLPTGPQNNGSCPPWPTFPGVNGFSNTPPGVGMNPFRVKDGDPGNETTLNHVLSTYGVIPNTRIREVMNTLGGYLCYVYE
jgi:tyrosinase